MADEFKAPWLIKPLDEWAIVGMNHYHVDGQQRLFVAMTKDGRCITEEGPDDQYLWNRLWHKVTESDPSTILIEKGHALMRATFNEIMSGCFEFAFECRKCRSTILVERCPLPDLINRVRSLPDCELKSKP